MSRFKNGALAIALAAFPGMAQAGTSTATGAASLNIVNQCSVAGANVDFGTFTANDTIADVTAVNGRWDMTGGGVLYTIGTRGIEYAEWGSVTCDNGTPYSITIHGTGNYLSTPNAVQFIWQNQSGSRVGLVMDILVKKVGSDIAPDTEMEYPGAGTIVSRQPVAGIGTGAPQPIRGSAIFNFLGVGDATGTYYVQSEKLVPGAYTDTLTYTLNF